jgi:hypothetical protein
MNIYKIKLLIYIQENLVQIFPSMNHMHYKNHVTHNYSYTNKNFM